MKRRRFDIFLSFLLGFAWAILLLGGWLLFHIASVFGWHVALFVTLVYVFLILCAVLMLEVLNLYKERVENSKAQTRLLLRIAELLDREA